MPFTIIHSAQFMEGLARVAAAGAHADVVRTPDAHVQPVAAVDVAGFVVAVATEPPAHGAVELAGPERFAFVTERLAEWLRGREARVAAS
jgi:uncharacterized protein YbjT (DUF2867 family)